MSEKRRDKKGRILRDNEIQKADGRYEYRYKDLDGSRKSVYSWRLVVTDKTPAGKRDRAPLREQEKTIQEDLNSGLIPNGKNLTVLELCKRYTATKRNVTQNTEAGYNTVLNTLKQERFGYRKIGDVSISEAKLFLIKLQKENKKSYSTIHSIRGVLRPAFQTAVDDDFIRKNPFDWQLSTVLVDDSHTREAISKTDERKFLNFIKSDEHFAEYYDGIYILFKTGMRISEFCGLCISDFDAKNHTLRIDHQLQRARNGNLYVIDKNTLQAKPKTAAGVRTLPLETDVYNAFRRILASRNKPEIEPIVDGYGGFLILNYRARKGLRPMVAMDWEHIFKRALTKYNNIYRAQLPLITPHVCRHTYCSHRAKEGMNPKVLQYLMGHSDISVTLNTYTHLGLEAAVDELKRMRENIAVVN